MEEAERLCDRVAIIDHGRIIDIDTPAALDRAALPGADASCSRRTIRGRRARFARIPRRRDGQRARPAASRFAGSGDDLVTDVIQCLAEHRIRVTDFRTDAADARGRVPQADRPFDSGLRSACCADSGKLTWLEIKIFVREPLGVFGTVGDSGRRCSSCSGGCSAAMPAGVRAGAFSRASDLPVLAALLIALSAVLSLVTIIAIYREGGILKRLRATPLRPHDDPDRPRARRSCSSRPSTLVLTDPGGARYYPVDLDVPRASASRWRCCSSRVSILSIGFLIASVVPTARFAQPIGALILYPMVGAVGAVRARRVAAAGARLLARLLPLTYAVSLLKGIWQGDSWSSHRVTLARSSSCSRSAPSWRRKCSDGNSVDRVAISAQLQLSAGDRASWNSELIAESFKVGIHHPTQVNPGTEGNDCRGTGCAHIAAMTAIKHAKRHECDECVKIGAAGSTCGPARPAMRRSVATTHPTSTPASMRTQQPPRDRLGRARRAVVVLLSGRRVRGVESME